MAARPKQRSSIARRVFLIVLFSLLVLLGGQAALLWWAYENLNLALARQPLDAATWIAIENVLLEQGLLLWPYAAGLLVGTLVLVWLLVRWTTGPLNQLVAAALAGDEDAARRLPLRAPGEVGQLARSFDDLSRSLQRSAREQHEQN